VPEALCQFTDPVIMPGPKCRSDSLLYGQWFQARGHESDVCYPVVCWSYSK